MNEAKDIARGLIEMLKMKNRLDLLPEVIDELMKLEELQNQQVVVESAVALSESDLHYLIKVISSKLGFEPEVVERINPDLLGGVKLRIGDQVIDVSLKYRLKKLRSRIN